MLQHLKEKKDVGFFTSVAGLMQQCWYERLTKIVVAVVVVVIIIIIIIIMVMVTITITITITIMVIIMRAFILRIINNPLPPLL